jgi:tetratricopeptide (TPR) repeat protein
MSSRDWFRNETWDESIEAAFDAKLARARDKPQYLVIQAIHLIPSHPEISLRLLDKYFELNDRFHRTRAFDAQAEAYLQLNDPEHAISSYEESLRAEKTVGGVQTRAYVELPFLVATRNIESWYDRSLELLDEFHDRPAFPIDHFFCHASRALIFHAQHKDANAKRAACDALAWAQKNESGFRYHQTLGLVDDKYTSLRARLAAMCNA